MTATREDSAQEPGRRTLLLTRVFDAPREVVFAAWVNPEQLAQWWGPNGFNAFQEITAPEQLVFTSRAAAEPGHAQLEVLHTATLAEHNGQTQLVLQARVMRATAAVAEAVAGMEEGWAQSLDRLGAFVARLGRAGHFEKGMNQFEPGAKGKL